MEKNRKKIKDGLVTILTQSNTMTASEVVSIVTDAHIDLMGNESLCKGSIALVNKLTESRMLQTDIEIFIEDLIGACSRHRDVNFSKYSYLDWLRYMEGEDMETMYPTKDIDPELDIGEDDLYVSGLEIKELLTHSGKIGAATVYSILYFLTGK